ncbi:hypothetical protein [Thiomonas sp. FB-Cd]|uniref:hypothetical protein n=1 Tax=Thiomonas sp. FB-Cd TaxID=1158292 RepID=UPI0012DCBED1|nr:hypothetical protein [Thiomonas sp. FB-Cd]
MQTHLGLNLPEGSHREVSSPHRELDGAEAMLDGSPSNARHAWGPTQAALHGFEDVFVLTHH